MKYRTVWIKVCVVLLLGYLSPIVAESVYVIDTLRVGVRASPEKGANTLEVVETGQTLEVLKKTEEHYQVKTESGRIGWIGTRYVDPTPPAMMRITKVQQQLDGLKQGLDERIALEQQKSSEALASLIQQLAQVQEANLHMELDLNVLKDQNAQLQQGLKQAQSQMWIPPQYRVQALLGLILLVFLMGSISGSRRVHSKMNRRFGGLDIRL